MERNQRRLLRAERARRGWTLKQAAAALGCHFTHLSRIEGGRRVPTLDLALRIETVFGIPPQAWARRRRAA